MNQESLDAYESSDTQRIRERVYDAVVEAGSDGLTSDELAATWEVQVSDISSRFTDLKKAKRIRQIGDGKRAGAVTPVCMPLCTRSQRRTKRSQFER